MPESIKPDPALRRLEKLTGRWEFSGRTLGAQEDNITGWNNFEWIAGGFFLKSEGEIDFKGMKMTSLEIIGYDPGRNIFPSKVYSSMSGEALDYEWDVKGSIVIHKGLGATYRGEFSEDGNTLTGGWRQDEGTPATKGAAYDAVMTRAGNGDINGKSQ